jgi:hypothetical protein
LRLFVPAASGSAQSDPPSRIAQVAVLVMFVAAGVVDDDATE